MELKQPVRDLSLDDLLSGLRNLRLRIEAAGVTHITLFGSRARQDHRPDSDIDLAIEIDDGRKFSLLDLIGVAHIIEDELGLSANMFMKRSLSPDFRNELARDGIPVF